MEARRLQKIVYNCPFFFKRLESSGNVNVSLGMSTILNNGLQLSTFFFY